MNTKLRAATAAGYLMHILPKKAYGLQHKAYSCKGSRVPEPFTTKSPFSWKEKGLGDEVIR
jgi:hypothetical protein